MKKRITHTLLLVCGGVLLLWGGLDLWNWATTGQELLAAYGEVEAIVQLVGDTLLCRRRVRRRGPVGPVAGEAWKSPVKKVEGPAFRFFLFSC